MLRSLLLGFCLALAGCLSVPSHRAAVSDDTTDRLTLGRVQKEIRVGMSGAEVVDALGSPNIVTTDEQRRQVWVYDRIATDFAYSSGQGGLLGLVFGTSGNAGGAGAAGVAQSGGARSSSQRAITVVIKYDADSKVREFSYRTARF
jgi:outer membrane protein assembly factor BamE (lipoprotein component of BamABCDE complex)